MAISAEIRVALEAERAELRQGAAEDKKRAQEYQRQARAKAQKVEAYDVILGEEEETSPLFTKTPPTTAPSQDATESTTAPSQDATESTTAPSQDATELMGPREGVLHIMRQDPLRKWTPKDVTLTFRELRDNGIIKSEAKDTQLRVTVHSALKSLMWSRCISKHAPDEETDVPWYRVIKEKIDVA